MPQRKKVLEDLEALNSLKNLAESYEEVAVVRMQKIKDSVLKTRDFLAEISEVFVDLKSSYDREIKELIKMFHKIGKSNREQILDCYQYGRNFEQKVEEIKNQNRKRITVQTARGKVYEEMKKQMINITKSAIRKRTQRAIIVFEREF